MNRVRKLIWLKNSIPKNAWDYFFSSNQQSPRPVSGGTKSSGPKAGVVGCSTEAGTDGRGGQRYVEPALLPSTCSNMTLSRISSRHTSHPEFHQKGDNSPSVQTQGSCGLEQKKLYYFLSLAKYFWAATVFTLLTGKKPYLVTNPLPAPMDNWLLSINVACGIFCWEVAQLLQNEDPNLLIIQQYWGYVTSLAHTPSHVPAASVPSFLLPWWAHACAHMRMCTNHTLWDSGRLPAFRFMQPKFHLQEFSKA